MKEKILIVEDQFIEGNNLRMILKKAGYLVCPIASSVPEAIKIVESESPDLVLLDIRLDGPLTGIDLAKILQDMHIAFVFLSANSDKQVLDAAKATRPYGFLVKPFREKDVLVTLDIAWYLHQESGGQKKLSPAVVPSSLQKDAFDKIIGESPGMIDVLDNIRIVGPSDTSVLILGESGTGKELVAQCIHEVSSRSMKPLVVVNCATLPANLIESELFGHEKGSFTGATDKRIGKFEQADGGTVFLDEIGELPIDLQVKFLRVLQEKEIEPIGGKKRKINVRVIAATNRNLEEEIASGHFRIDLYYRLNVFPIGLPPLRERKEDIPLLVNHFLCIYADKENKVITGLEDHVMNALINYSWPGNIRELENVMARTVLLTNGPIVDAIRLPFEKKNLSPEESPDLVRTINENERDHIVRTLVKCGWKVYGRDGAAALLEINGSTLSSRMKKLGIDKKAYLNRLIGGKL